MSSIITFPSNSRINFAEPVSLQLERKTIIMRSPYSGKRQALAQAYALWSMKGKFARIDDAVAAGLLRSFLFRLEGQANRVRINIPGYANPSSGYGGAAGLVNGASQTGKVLVTDGWANSTLLLNPGDLFNVNDELKVINTAVSSNGSGQATLNFDPPLRTSPTDNQNIFIYSPYCLFASNVDTATWQLSSPVLHDFDYDFIEAPE